MRDTYFIFKEFLLIFCGLFVSFSCTYYENEVIKLPTPKVSKETNNLIAEFTISTPDKISSSYWSTADFVKISLDNYSINNANEDDGLLNVNGTYNGLSDFNNGKDPELTIKAAYDDEFIYILASWNDTTFNMSNGTWLYNGPADHLKADSPDGWTSQRSDDNIVFEFDIDDTKKDIWKWSLALSEPMGYAIDKFDEGFGEIVDSGDKNFTRNTEGTGNRAGPAFEWDGVQQDLDRVSAGFTILDPGYYLYNKKSFEGNIINGELIYQNDCARCHGTKGKGDGFDFDTGVAMTIPGDLNRTSKEGLISYLSSGNHDGSGDFNNLTDEERTDVIARIRAFTGVPGYYLQNPTGSNSDVLAVSNIQLAKIQYRDVNPGYVVLFKRSLNTNNLDDIVLDPNTSNQINFNVLLSNNDDDNTVGAIGEILTFKTN